MKNYSKLSLMALFLVAGKAITPSEREELEQRKAPVTQDARTIEEQRRDFQIRNALDEERRATEFADREYTIRKITPQQPEPKQEPSRPISRSSQEIENAELFYNLMEMDIKRAGGKISPDQERAITNQLEKFSPEALRYIETNATTPTMKNLASQLLQRKEIENAKDFYMLMEIFINKAGGKINPEDEKGITSQLEKFSPDTLRYVEKNAQTPIMKKLAYEALQRKEPTYLRRFWNNVSSAFSRK